MSTDAHTQIMEHWKWVHKNVTKTGRLESMEEKEVLAFLNYVFSLLASGKEEKAKHQCHLLTSESVSSTTASTSSSDACLSTGDEVSSSSSPSSPASSSTGIRSIIVEEESGNGQGDDDDEDLCKLCFENKVDTIILDCGHTLLCGKYVHSVASSRRRALIA